jgi:small-conductance mechanosensitive channel
VGGYGLNWIIRHWIKARDLNRSTPNWLNVDTLLRLLLPLLMWFFAHVALAVYEHLEQPTIWFDFLAKLFGTFLMVRIFLHMVRRAMPEGSLRHVIERGTVVLIWLVMFLDYVGKLDQWLHVLDGFKVSLGKNTVTASDVVALLLVILVMYLIVKWLAYEIEVLLLKRPNKYFAQVDLSSRVVLTRILKGLLLVFGVLFSLTAVGIDLTVLSVFGGALGVGIGLGLQKIASNYVSGFVMLFERSVRIGDLITTSDGYRGNVTQINARYTIIQGADGNEVLVPNETLVTQPVVNWSLHDKSIWMNTAVQVKHNTDIDEIRPKLLEAIKNVPRVLDKPAPSAFLSKITDKGFVIELTWWINDPENGRMNVTSEVNLAIWRVCREYGVEFFTLQAAEVLDLPK